MKSDSCNSVSKSVCSIRYCSVIDADMQHPPRLLKNMFDAIIMENADMCIPSRFIETNKENKLNFYRRFISWVARKMGNLLIYNMNCDKILVNKTICVM